MYYLPQVKVKAMAELNRRRERAERECEERRADALSRIPGLKELEDKISSACTELCRVIGMGDEAVALFDKIRAENLQAQEEEKRLLKAHGLAADTMRLRYTCPVCEDSGFDERGRFCRCHRQLLKDLEHERLGELFPIDDYTFDAFSLAYYPKPAREAMGGILEYCKTYARDFDDCNPSLFFYGETGLGKTHLSGAIINEVIKKGFGVEYGSVPLLLSRLAKERFDNRAENITERALLAADLLVLDDLGAESANGFTAELLYTLINTRLLKRLPTIINSNCTQRELEERYGRRIASRLLYDGYEAFHFSGKDIRQQKTGNQE
ncbi:MAG: ATP-binding protein [Clostridium sp.]|jgi:DNA replication protein DnaC|nr:ATP-binding protein [Clostridium sp.]